MQRDVRRTAAVAAVLAGGWAACLGIPLAGRQPAGAAIDARIARVERGLLPGIVITGEPQEGMRLADRMAFYATPGVSVAVINGGAIEWARGYGVAEAGGSTPVTPRTRFQAASISKPVASLAALLLVSQGRLSLDEPVNARLDSWKVPENEFTAKVPVTLRRLLSHTAGLTVHGFGGYPAGSPTPSLLQVLDGAKPANSAPIRVDVLPGSLNRYSGGGYTVAQQLMIDVTGKPFPSLMSELVLRPLAMANSTYEQPLPAALGKEAASGHRGSGKPIQGRYHTYPEMAAAGLWTTPTDLARFALELQRALGGASKVIPAATAREMTTSVMDDYGLGLGVPGTGAAARFTHGGANEGFRCQMVAFFSGGQGAVVMTNGDRGGALAVEVFRAVAREYGWPAFQPKEKHVVQLDAKALAAFEGRYELGAGHVVTLRVTAGTLFVIDGDERVKLFAESASKFFDTVEENSIEFVKGADGAVTHMLINGTLRARRLGPA
jgi:CubicO group peptidase (beta-lactamase class C family)